MNIHPLFVHFPIALLSVYAVFEIVSIRRWQESTWIHPFKTILLTIGSVFSFLSLSTGELAEESVLIKNSTLRSLIETHSLFATITTYLFVALALAYLFETLLRSVYVLKVPKGIQKVIGWYSQRFLTRSFRRLLAVGGLITVFITGALGGAIVYGPTADPFVNFIYTLFFP